MEYNRIMLGHMTRVRAMCTEIMKMSAISQESIASGDFELEVIKKAVTRYAEEQTSIFFPEEDDEKN